LDEPAAVALAVQLDEEHALPGAELELALSHRHRLAGGAEQHRHAVRVAVALLHVLGADVLGAAVEVVVRVVALGGYELLQELREVFEEAGLELVDPHAACGVRRVDARDPLGDSAFANGLLNLVGDVPYGQAAGGAKPGLALEDLHGAHSAA